MLFITGEKICSAYYLVEVIIIINLVKGQMVKFTLLVNNAYKRFQNDHFDRILYV